MNRHIKSICFSLALFLIACTEAANDFQTDADIVRLNHLEYYGNLLVEYNQKTGSYPFSSDADVPLYIFVASPEQVDDIQGGPPYRHKVVEFKKLIEEFRTVLGKDIKEYYDPQFEPDRKPNFYIYMVDGGTYNFAIHTSQPFSFSNPVAPGYNKVEITNNKNGSPHLIYPKDLFSMEEFQKARSQKISKPEFFTSREDKYLYATQTK